MRSRTIQLAGNVILEVSNGNMSAGHVLGSHWRALQQRPFEIVNPSVGLASAYLGGSGSALFGPRFASASHRLCNDRDKKSLGSQSSGERLPGGDHLQSAMQATSSCCWNEPPPLWKSSAAATAETVSNNVTNHSMLPNVETKASSPDFCCARMISSPSSRQHHSLERSESKLDVKKQENSGELRLDPACIERDIRKTKRIAAHLAQKELHRPEAEYVSSKLEVVGLVYLRMGQLDAALMYFKHALAGLDDFADKMLHQIRGPQQRYDNDASVVVDTTNASSNPSSSSKATASDSLAQDESSSLEIERHHEVDESWEIHQRLEKFILCQSRMMSILDHLILSEFLFNNYSESLTLSERKVELVRSHWRLNHSKLRKALSITNSTSSHFPSSSSSLLSPRQSPSLSMAPSLALSLQMDAQLQHLKPAPAQSSSSSSSSSLMSHISSIQYPNKKDDSQANGTRVFEGNGIGSGNDSMTLHIANDHENRRNINENGNTDITANHFSNHIYGANHDHHGMSASYIYGTSPDYHGMNGFTNMMSMTCNMNSSNALENIYALNRRQDIWTRLSASLISSLDVAARLATSLGDHDKALALAHESLLHRQKMPGFSCIRIVEGLILAGDTLLAAALHRESCSIEHESHANHLPHQQQEMQLQEPSKESALQAYLKAHVLLSTSSSPIARTEEMAQATVLSRIGAVLLRQEGRASDALRVFLEAHRIRVILHGAYSDSVAASLRDISAARFQLGDLSGVARALSDELQIHLSNRGMDDPLTEHCLAKWKEAIEMM